jgi:hypothetical protein
MFGILSPQRSAPGAHSTAERVPSVWKLNYRFIGTGCFWQAD